MTGPEWETEADSGEEPRNALVAWLIGPTFLLLAVWFIRSADLNLVPVIERQRVDAAEFTSDPMRTPLTDPPTIEVAGFTKRCTECHDLFRTNPKQALFLNQHRNLVQAHGMNDRCLNCHDQFDRSRLSLPGGETVSFAETPRLCATCHGLLYRDWERGMHGRTTGSWDPERGQRRLGCSECHDPHAPAFASMTALPGPNTLRMGEIKHGRAEPAQRNPLRQRRGSGNGEEH